MAPAEYRNKIICGDAREKLRDIPPAIVQSTVTSPPYYGLRDYGTGSWLGGDPECKHLPSSTLTTRGLLTSTLRGGKKHTAHRLEGYLSICKHCGAEREDKQLGLERSPEVYTANQLGVFNEIHRITRKDGTLWLNIGDSYATGGRGYGYSSIGSENTYAENLGWRNRTPGLKHKDMVGIPWRLAFALQGFAVIPSYSIYEWVQLLDEAIAKLDWELVKIVRDQLDKYNLLQGMENQGWILRQDIIWAKPNPMPESVKDRCTKSHEYIFLFAKHKNYYYDAEAIATPYMPKTYTAFGSKISGAGDGSGLVMAENRANRMDLHLPKDWNEPGRNPRNGVDTRGGNQGTPAGIPYVSKKNLLKIKNASIPGEKPNNMNMNRAMYGEHPYEQLGGRANKKDVWTIATSPFKKAHYAVQPLAIARTCILAGSRPGDLVCDPYGGAGTTAVVAAEESRNYLLVELNPDNIVLSERRLVEKCGLFANNIKG